MQPAAQVYVAQLVRILTRLDMNDSIQLNPEPFRSLLDYFSSCLNDLSRSSNTTVVLQNLLQALDFTLKDGIYCNWGTWGR